MQALTYVGAFLFAKVVRRYEDKSDRQDKEDSKGIRAKRNDLSIFKRTGIQRETF